jgi:cell division topological specificity factor
MNLLRFFQPAASAPMARERLQILLEYERKLGSQIDLFAVLREEILAVVGRHVSVDPEKVQVTVDRRAKFSTLAVDIEMPNGDPRRHRDAADGGRPFRSSAREPLAGRSYLRAGRRPTGSARPVAVFIDWFARSIGDQQGNRVHRQSP